MPTLEIQIKINLELKSKTKPEHVDLCVLAVAKLIKMLENVRQMLGSNFRNTSSYNILYTLWRDLGCLEYGQRFDQMKMSKFD